MININVQKKEDNIKSVNEMPAGSVFMREGVPFILGDEKDCDGDYWATRLRDGVMIPIPRREQYLVVSSVTMEVVL